MAHELFQELRDAFETGEPFALCTVIETSGSSPGKVGQKMLVFPDGETSGTVGGGVNEERVRKAALELFNAGGSRLLSFSLDNPIEGNEPVCGGGAKVYIEVFADRPRLVVFGGGHIGRVLARMAHLARFQVSLVDERPASVSPESVPEIDDRICCPYEESVERARIDQQTSVVIVTPGHVKDRQVLERVLKTPASYIGMIGSRRKVDEMKKAIIADGADPARVSQIFSPIGIHLGGDSPEEIAVSILAQIIAFKNGKTVHYHR